MPNISNIRLRAPAVMVALLKEIIQELEQLYTRLWLDEDVEANPAPTIGAEEAWNALGNYHPPQREFLESERRRGEMGHIKGVTKAGASMNGPRGATRLSRMVRSTDRLLMQS